MNDADLANSYKKMWILVIEDEQRLAQVIKRGLEAEGYQVDVALDGEEGEMLAAANAYDALIVDWRLPKQDGKTVIQHLRADGHTYPILMLTVLEDVEYRVEGLDAGADDYMRKPFSFEELLARLRALLRRPPLAAHEHLLQIGALKMNTERRSFSVGSQPLLLRPKEFALMELFMRNPNALLSRTVLAERVWGSALYVSDNVIDVTVSSLRHKLEEAKPQLDADGDENTVFKEIETVRGVGYRLLASEPE
ncbi:MAG: response regulator transcription factor [Bacteroidetes bacterium]|nr:response regulator transcription factor [Bacteroidota bacterium]